MHNDYVIILISQWLQNRDFFFFRCHQTNTHAREYNPY